MARVYYNTKGSTSLSLVATQAAISEVAAQKLRCMQMRLGHHDPGGSKVQTPRTKRYTYSAYLSLGQEA
jgi:hypothetical protein